MTAKIDSVDSLAQELFECCQHLPKELYLSNEGDERYFYTLPMRITKEKSGVQLNNVANREAHMNMTRILTQIVHWCIPLHHKRLRGRQWDFENPTGTLNISFRLIGNEGVNAREFWVEILFSPNVATD